MVAVKAALADRFCQSPPEDCKAALVYGSDSGLVSERAAQLCQLLANRLSPPGEIIRIDDTDLEDNPDRLTVELQTVSMFGDGKVVRTVLGRRINGTMIKGIVEQGAPEAALVIEGGNLKTSDAARKAFERAKWAAAIPCYGDSERDLTGLVRDLVSQHGFTISAEATEALVERLGADRALSRGEIEKLILYVGDRASIEADDVLAIVGDASELAIDIIVIAAADGDAKTAVRELDRAVTSGENPQSVIAAVQRYFRRLHRLRVAIDGGKSFDDAARSLRPPLFFKQKSAVGTQCRHWAPQRLTTALARIGEVAKMARLESGLEHVLTERLLLELATMARTGKAR